MTSSHHAPYDLGYTRTTMGVNKEKRKGDLEPTSKTHPRSLAATWGISFDYSSSDYLDVSVRPVPFSYSVVWMTVHNHSRIAPFGYLRVTDYLHLSAAFRSLSRPSSADIAKASPVCS